ncbi:hypothetical protein PFISCL1PPCAC_15378 [Pristionchus fissidentatus]|uniref:Uncharacterized protein n=1 Tax=Pristionchus fissidentatus TaxID=1538716 RepID=A0AAV5VZY9_9BILA|nr:hypothetical protein PFISCL1PPCAC_15378 [Pristionchus fissidentatus]
MAGDRICGCHVVTAAGVITSLQFILLLICLSSSGIILDRYRIWVKTEQGSINATEAALAVTQNRTLKTAPTRWALAWVELGMAWYTAYGSFWLFSLFILTLSFKYYRPVFVVPNFTALIVGIFMHLFAFGVCIGRILAQSKNYQVNDYQEAIIVYCCGLFLFALILTLFFIIFVMKYHNYLRMRYGHQVPKFVQSRGPRTGYQDEMY